jgi:autotransporter-associated beta strand protein
MKSVYGSAHGSFTRAGGVFLVLALFALAPAVTQAATRIKQNNTHDLNLAASWDVLPGAADIALWSSTVTAANRTSLGADLSWLGIKIVTPGGPVTIEAGHSLTLGASGIDLSTATQDLTLNCGLTLRGRQTWKAAFYRMINVAGSFNRTGAVVDFSAFPTNAGLGTLGNDASGILGPWATWGSGTSLYYVKCTPQISPFLGATAATAGTLANVISPSVNYTYAASANLTVNITANTLRFTGSSATVANGGKTVTLNGLLNAASGTSGSVSFSGTGNVIIGSNRELVIISNTRNLSIFSLIADNPAGSSGLTYSGGGTLSLFAANTYSGGTTVDAGTLAVVNSGSTLGRGDVTLNAGTLSLGTGTSNVIGDTNTVTIADGAIVTLASGINEAVRDLYLGGRRASSGTWGSSDSGSEHIDDAHLSGGGVFTVLNAENDPTRIPRLSGTLDFGTVATNAAATLSVEVWNDGNQSLSVTDIQVPASFSVTPRAFTVPVGAAVALTVSFTPSAVIPYAGQLTLECNATAGTTSLAVSGAGVVPPPPPGVRTIAGLHAVIAIDVPEEATVLGVEDELSPGMAPVTISDGGSWDAVNRKVKWFFNEAGQVRDRALQYTVASAGNVVAGSVNFGQGNKPVTGDTAFSGGEGHGLLHSADDNGDWRVTLQEVSASVNRWKSGQDDTKTPIVVRGITLYLQGEQYRYDPAISSEAKRWIALAGLASLGTSASRMNPLAPLAAILAIPQTGAVRSVDTTNVTITVTPASGTVAWGMEESVPSGVQVTAVGNSGTWDASHRRIKWAFFDGNSRALSYTVNGLPGTNVTVTGSASFDGSDDAVSGTTSLAIPLSFPLWAERHGLSGDADAAFRAAHAEYGQPNGIVYAFQSNLKSGDLLLEIGWDQGAPYVETPKQDPATLAFVEISLEGKRELSDADWSLSLQPAQDQSAVPGNRCRWTPLSVPDRAFYRLRVVPK